MEKTFKRAAIVVAGIIFLPGWLGAAQPNDKTPESWHGVQNILKNRCVVCHACNSSPCQIDLTTMTGVERGGLDDAVYAGTRLLPQDPTRLYIDASTTKEWREIFEFYPVVDRKHPQKSLLLNAVKLGTRRGLDYQGHEFESGGDWTCIEQEGWSTDDKLGKKLGMPYGLPPLTKKEVSTLENWAEKKFPGAPLADKDVLAGMPESIKQQVRAWESYLNQDRLKDQIVARYLYEHLFLAHIQIDTKLPHFFRLVRSKTPAPKPVEEIATRRPYSDPGEGRVYYRFRPIWGPILHKSHVTFPFSAALRERLQRDFNDSKWRKVPEEMPSYEDSKAANPFLTFQAIPSRARYNLFLTNARYFVMTFIRGPVCEGQIAVNVIRDHFNVFFLDPDFDLSITDPTFLDEAKDYLDLPAEGDNSPIEAYYEIYKAQQKKYLKLRAKRYQKVERHAYSVKSLWDGGGKDIDAALTVFRHFDSAGVVHGPVGGVSQTVWVIDYPIFERLYYLLVAGFDVFGNVIHQSSTRMYMDNLRVESENNFLYMLPYEAREKIRKSWYLGEDAKEKMAEENELFSTSYKPDLNIKIDAKQPLAASGDLQKKIFEERLPFIDTFDPYNCCTITPNKEHSKLTTLVRLLTAPHQRFARYMPEMTFLHVLDKKAGVDKVLFVSKLTGHKNVAFMFNEKDRLDPRKDRLIVHDDWLGSFPNLMIQTDLRGLSKMVNELKKSGNKKAVSAVLAKHAMVRNQKDFWSRYDQIVKRLEKIDPHDYGLPDLSKYENIYR